jgi:pyrroloquinoline quinone biosynthesis protein B
LGQTHGGNMKSQRILLESEQGEVFKRRVFIKRSLYAGASILLSQKSYQSPLRLGPDKKKSHIESPIMVKFLGTAQDGGFPQMACYCDNCRAARKNPKLARKVVSLGVLNHKTGKSFMIEATPDAARQVEMIQAVDPKFQRFEGNPIDGILLTHADIGHYSGLVQFRPEVTTIRNLAVFCTKIMAGFLSENEPWRFMVQRNIITLMPVEFEQPVRLDDEISFRAIKIPHDKHSDMAGFMIRGPNRSLLFIPDIDQWEDRFLDIVASADYAVVDGTFYSERKGSKIHPLITESMAFFKDIAEAKKTSIIFIHFNHNSHLLSQDTSIRESIEAKGFYVADDGDELWL